MAVRFSNGNKFQFHNRLTQERQICTYTLLARALFWDIKSLHAHFPLAIEIYNKYTFEIKTKKKC